MQNYCPDSVRSRTWTCRPDPQPRIYWAAAGVVTPTRFVVSQAHIKNRQELMLKYCIRTQLQAMIKEANLTSFNQSILGAAKTPTKVDTNTVESIEVRRKHETREPVSGNPDSPGDDKSVTLTNSTEVFSDTRLLSWLPFTEKRRLGVTDTLYMSHVELYIDSMRRYYDDLIEKEDIEVGLTEHFDINDIPNVQLVELQRSPFFTLVIDLSCKVYPHDGAYISNHLESSIKNVIPGGNHIVAIHDGCLQCWQRIKDAVAKIMRTVPLEKRMIAPRSYASQINQSGPIVTQKGHEFGSKPESNSLDSTCIDPSAGLTQSTDSGKAQVKLVNGQPLSKQGSADWETANASTSQSFSNLTKVRLPEDRSFTTCSTEIITPIRLSMGWNPESRAKGHENRLLEKSQIIQAETSQTRTMRIAMLAHDVATSSGAKTAPTWPISGQDTARVLGKLVLVSEKSDVVSPVGSENRQRERIADQNKLAGISAE